LRTLPASVCRLVHLRRLYVDSNRLGEGGDEALPADLGLLPALELFSASDNGLTSVPESLAQCRTLCRLLLADNRLKRLPAGIQVPDVVVVAWDANAVMRSTLIGSCTPTPTPLRIYPLPIPLLKSIHGKNRHINHRYLKTSKIYPSLLALDSLQPSIRTCFYMLLRVSASHVSSCWSLVPS